MSATTENQYGAFESLLHEIEIAENNLRSLNSRQGKQHQQDISERNGALTVTYLEEEINQLKNKKPDGDLEDEGGLHYYLAVGEIEKEVKELRKVAEVTKSSIDGNKATLESLESMLSDQREVVATLEKELETDGAKEASPPTVDDKMKILKEKIQLNKLILSELKASFRDLISSQTRTESEAGRDPISLVLQTLWKKFVSSGPECAVADLDQLGTEVDSEYLEQLSRAGIIKQEGSQLRLVNLSSE